MMRKLTPLLFLTMFAVAVPSYAARGQDQSYITFDDGGTTIHQGDDDREVEARVNFPIYPGDEVTTSRTGRTEIRLADGNIIALDRSTSVSFRSILDSYEVDSSQSVIELKYGHVVIQRTDSATEVLRLDTSNASYAATDEAIYAVEAGDRGRDRVSVYNGSIEVRTPQRSNRLERGDEAHVDDEGLYGLVSSTAVADDFERWFIRRSDRYSSTASSRYLDRSLAYSDADLQENGSWVFASSFGGWGWRPNVAVGWRPYYYGRWGNGPNGCLTWISDESWGWVPYHYGRWAYDGGYGWIWLPGYTYAPAWVYWAYGPGYIGWAPAGWYDCYRPYYNWAYRPYSRAGFDFGFGFYGRVRLNEVDLRPWTFVNPNGITSHRIDQAAINTDAIRQRLIRDPNQSLATVSGLPARFTRSELKDPAAAVNTIARRGLVGGTRGGSTTVADMTPFFRRDAQLSNVVRERIVRSRVVEPIGGFTTPSGIPSPGTPGTLEGRSGGRDGGGTRSDNQSGQIIDRGRIYNSDPKTAARERESNWRDQINRAQGTATTHDRSAAAPNGTTERPQKENWRGRAVQRGAEGAVHDRTPVDPKTSTRGADIPRRIIDRIGGARLTSGDTPRDSAPPRESSPPREEKRERESAPPPAPPRTERSSPPPPRRESSPPPKSGGGEGHGGKVKRDR